MELKSLTPSKIQVFVILMPVFSLLFYASVMLDIWPARAAVVVFVAMSTLLVTTAIAGFMALIDRLWLAALLNIIPVFLLGRYVLS